jgi:glutamyl-tRNA synthetase
MVSNPKKLTVKNLSITSVEVLNHPVKDMGKRKIDVDGSFYISGEDAQNIKEGEQIRLLGLGNILITKQGEELEGEHVKDGDIKSIPKIQWVSQKTAHEIKIIIPKILFIDEKFNEDSLEETLAYCEPHYLQIKDGDEIQFIRFGYCRKDSQNQAIFTHK